MVVVAILLAAAGAGHLARESSANALALRAEAAASLASASLSAVIDKQRLVPMTLALNPEVIALLASPVPEPRLRAHLDEQLAAVAKEADAAVLYIIGTDGVAVSASNAGTADSFVGSDYGFRTYFTRAMAEGSAQQYALGTVSGRPGLYLSRRVDGPLGPVGVVVVKVEFDALEARWRDSGLVVHVTDEDGIVVATTEPAWRFGSVGALVDEARVRAHLQIGDAPLVPVPIDMRDDGRATIDRQTYVAAATPVGGSAPGWRLTVFVPSSVEAGAAARSAQTSVLLAGLLLALAGLALLRRRRWTLARQAALTAMNNELERRVAIRTEELHREITEREAAEGRVRRLRDDLAQANRLSILGQVSAGVAHEINQPLAAIRTYAETGGRLLDAGHVEDARDNLRQIVSVTERIGAITQTLRGFARRGAGEIRPIAVGAAMDGAMALLGGRIRDAGVTIVRDTPDANVAVLAGRIRLEQILVNLLQNALDAVRGVADPTISLRAVATPNHASITVADNGPGVAEEVREHLFMPFNTTKETGLGLGLVISGDIAREFGGTLSLEGAAGRGAAFTLTLPRARQ